VSVLGTDGKVADREVKVGVMNRVSAQIVSGLEPGEKVVIGTKAPAAPATQTGSALVPSAGKGGGRP
jgi:macrolide-specific efflux system membrane fusion protein